MLRLYQYFHVLKNLPYITISKVLVMFDDYYYPNTFLSASAITSRWLKMTREHNNRHCVALTGQDGQSVSCSPQTRFLLTTTNSICDVDKIKMIYYLLDACFSLQYGFPTS